MLYIYTNWKILSDFEKNLFFENPKSITSAWGLGCGYKVPPNDKRCVNLQVLSDLGYNIFFRASKT